MNEEDPEIPLRDSVMVITTFCLSAWHQLVFCRWCMILVCFDCLCFCVGSPSPIAAFHSHVTVPLEATKNLMKHIIRMAYYSTSYSKYCIYIYIYCIGSDFVCFVLVLHSQESLSTVMWPCHLKLLRPSWNIPSYCSLSLMIVEPDLTLQTDIYLLGKITQIMLRANHVCKFGMLA